jgi:para-nitrobenzyl esterase
MMSGAWVSFARTGDPNHAGLPDWPAVTPDSVPTILFDRVCDVRIDHDKELMEFFPEVKWSFPGPKIMKAIFGIEPPKKL